jgi:hypothetical protein
MKKTILLFFALALFTQAGFTQKADVQDVISKNLASIKSADQKVKITNLTAVGETSWVQGTNHQKQHTGKSVLVSDGRKTALAVAFPLQDYPFERLIFDGRKVTAPFVRPGIRSALGTFIDANEEIVKEGIFGGVLTTGWTFNHPEEKKGSFSMQGMKKVDGKEMQVVNYATKGGSGLTIRLLFDPETGRHVRTEYRRKSTQSMSRTPEASASLTNDIIEEMSEDFGDFKTEAGVTLPTSYKIRVAQIFGTNTREWTYTMKIATFYYNQELDASTFVASNN